MGNECHSLGGADGFTDPVTSANAVVPLGFARIRHTTSPGIIQYPAPYHGHPRTRVKGSQHTLASANASCPRP